MLNYATKFYLSVTYYTGLRVISGEMGQMTIMNVCLLEVGKCIKRA